MFLWETIVIFCIATSSSLLSKVGINGETSLFHQFYNFFMMQLKKKLIILGLIFTIFVVTSVLFLIKFMLNDLYFYSNQLREGMHISEVRNLLNKSFVESDITIGQIEEDGYSLSHFSITENDDLCAKKYAYRSWKQLYFYIIYNDDKSQLIIEAFE